MIFHITTVRGLTAMLLLFASATSGFAIRPYARYVSTPGQQGLSYDSLNISTVDHFRLTGWYCKPYQDSSGLLIIMVGTDAGNMSYGLPGAQFLVQNFKVPVLLFDYRGFGTSQPFVYDSTAIAEPEYVADIDAVVEYASKHYSDHKIILYGRSMGAALSIVEACKRSGITGVVAESPYVSQKLLKKHFEDKSINSRTDTVRIIRSLDLEPLARIARFEPKNFLLLHGSIEKFMLSDEEKSLIDTVPATNKRFLDFEGCDHLELPYKAPQKFGDAMAKFLTQCQG